MVDEADRKARVAVIRKASEPILAELAQAGVQAQSLSDLINTSIDYQSAVPLLIEWLPRTGHRAVKEMLARALTVKWARPEAAQPLIAEFLLASETKEPGLKWAIGNALSVVADASVFDEIVELVRDKGHGRARQMLAVALGNMKEPRAVGVLIELLDDEQVAGHALMGLRKMAPPEARSAIERFVDHPRTWVRNEAKKALTKLDKKLARSGEE